MNLAIKNDKKNIIKNILGGTIVAISVTLILILIFALMIRYLDISNNWIFPINQVIKVISIIIGSIVFLKKDKSKGFLKGIFLGILYYIISYIIFSVLQGNFSLNISNLYDFILTSLMGGILGIIAVNIIKN